MDTTNARPETLACDREVRSIVGKDAELIEDEEPAIRPIEKEIEQAAKVPAEEIKEKLPETLIQHLKSATNLEESSNENGTRKSCSSGTASEPGSRGSRGESPTRSTLGTGEPEIKFRLGGISGRNSRKGSSCSTPVLCPSRAELGYPSPNFVRGQLDSLCQEVSVDEDHKLTIRLHYNPVMDEWVSLTDDSAHLSDFEKDLDTLFDLHKVIGNLDENSVDVINIGSFLKALEKTGIKRDDPRLKDLRTNLESINQELFPDVPIESMMLERTLFKRAVRDNFCLLSLAFKNQFVIPEFSYFTQRITSIYKKCREFRDGKVASYIPQLARYDPNLWGVSICTVDGQRFSIGDTRVPFTIQSSSKPFTYAVCLNELGRDKVHEFVGQEPSGRMFNELTLDSNNKPHNPLLNSGAIMSAAILLNVIHPEKKISEKFDFLSDYFKRIAGGEFLSFNNSVFLSERESADRNYALAYYMKENKCFPKGFQMQDCIDFYFQSCSMEVNCETIAVMGATLANGGKCPISNEEVLRPESVRDVLSLMHSCGMYNYSGQFAFDVGLPAKSGVSGALVLVVPNIMGIGLFSPPLDSLGNSVRGVQFSRELVKVFRFHRFDNLITTSLTKDDPRQFKDEFKRQKTLSLLYSATTGDLTALKRFKSTNTRMNVTNYDGRSALHLACAEGHLSCAKFLVQDCNLDPMQKDRWGFTPLLEAQRFRHKAVVDFLVKYMEVKCPEKLKEMVVMK